MTSCECRQPGFCERHRCQKNEHWFWLCQTREDYFGLWEEGRGPGQNGSMPHRSVLSVPCRERGSLIREQPCSSCCGTVRVKVFACMIHGACTIGRHVDDLACCATCADYEASKPVDQTQTAAALAIPDSFI